MPKETSSVSSKKYNEMLTSNKFDLVVKCKECHSYNCFIGIKDHDLDAISGNVSISMICANCGEIEVGY